MTLEPFLLILAPLSIFILGVLIIPSIAKPKSRDLSDSYEIINQIEKKYIY
tara:strand:- start:1707 stop:1859 length:153 start_codon:yes stop_codon:yes gene_type:complete